MGGEGGSPSIYTWGGRGSLYIDGGTPPLSWGGLMYYTIVPPSTPVRHTCHYIRCTYVEGGPPPYIYRGDPPRTYTKKGQSIVTICRNTELQCGPTMHVLTRKPPQNDQKNPRKGKGGDPRFSGKHPGRGKKKTCTSVASTEPSEAQNDVVVCGPLPAIMQQGGLGGRQSPHIYRRYRWTSVYIEGDPHLQRGHPPPMGWINVLHHRSPSTPVQQVRRYPIYI